jgi:hypothetical protein
MKQGYCSHCYSTVRLGVVLAVLLLLVQQLAAVVQSYQQPNSSSISISSSKANHQHIHRRAFLTAPLVAVATFATCSVPSQSQQASSSSSAWALDMDAFMNQELNKDSVKPTLSQDEALCRFGQPSQATGEACLRAGLSTKRRSGGTLNAFGTVDRGDFVRCKYEYQLDGKGGYDKITVCSDGSKR